MSNVVSIARQTARCETCRLADSCPMLDGTGAPAEAVPAGRVRVMHEGDRLYRAGDRVDAVYRVRTGVVKTGLTAPDGSEQVTSFFGAGEWVGLDALDGGRHRGEAVALDTASVCVIPVAALRERLAACGRASRLMVEAMSRRIASRDGMHLTLARDSAVQRMAGFLLDLSGRRAAAGLDPDEIALPMSRGEIASYLALAVETVSRLLTRMQRSGAIRVHRSRVEVLDRDALCEAAGVGGDSPRQVRHG